MAIKIPDAPNIIGGDAVLRSDRGINGSVTPHNISVDNRAVEESVKGLGSLFANVEQIREDTMLTDAYESWTMNMDNHMREIEDKYKGRNAVNLYEREVKTYSDKLNSDLFGAPKDDGKIRISNKAIQEKFRQWTNKQLVQYNARIGRYEAEELTKYNESTFDAREAQITNQLRNAKSVPEIIGGQDSFYELQGVRYRGLNPDYIKQMAASKVDAAVVENIKDQIQTDVRAGRNFYVNNPEVRAVLSASSQDAINQKIKEEWVAQAITHGGEGLASGDNGAELNNWIDASVLGQVFGTEKPEELNAIRQKIYGGAKERSDALTKQAEGMADMIRGQQAAQLASVKTNDDLLNALQNISVTDRNWASQVDGGVQRDLALAGRMEALRSVADTDLAERAERYKKYEKSVENIEKVGKGSILYDMIRGKSYKEGDAKKQGFVEGLVNPAGLVSAATGVVNLLSYKGEAPEALSAEEAYVLEAYQAEKQAVQEELKQRSEVYTDLLNDVVNGRYVGGYDERLDKLGGAEQKAIYQAVAAEQAFRNVSARYPKMDAALKSLDTKYDDSAMARAKRIFAEEVNKADHNGATRIDDTRLQQLANYSIAQSKDSVSNALSSAISGSLADNDIVEAGISAFSSDKALKAVKASDNTYDKQGKRAKKVIRQFRNNLPEGYRSVVDDHEDLLMSWYRVGNTPAILNFVRSYMTTIQSSGGKL